MGRAGSASLEAVTELCAWPCAPLAAALLLAPVMAFAPRTAHAQVHWDAHVEAGVAKRFLRGGSLSGGFGPLVGLDAHVALMPLLRVGAYVDEEVAPTGEPSSRHVTSFGLRLKAVPPWPRADLRVWAFAGFGYAAVSAPGYHQALMAPDGVNVVNADATAFDAHGHFFEVPVGVGAAWRFRRPWELTTELSGRIGLGASGNYYDPVGRPGVVTSSGLPIGLGPIGQDALALILTVGIGFDL